MRRNIELKAKLVSLDFAHATARSIGAERYGIERQRDTYFPAARGRLKLRERWTSDDNGAEPHASPAQLIAYDRCDAAVPRPSDYRLVVVEHAAELRDALAASLGTLAVVEKHRSIYIHNQVRIHLDTVADLGFFLEFEAIVNESCDDRAAYEKISGLEKQFGIEASNILDQSYADLILAARAI